ncbi:MAG: hypothetical protein ACRDC4_03210, partial [Plesiomonas sp.]
LSPILAEETSNVKLLYILIKLTSNQHFLSNGVKKIFFQEMKLAQVLPGRLNHDVSNYLSLIQSHPYGSIKRRH